MSDITLFLIGALWGLQVASYASSLPTPIPGKAGRLLARLGGIIGGAKWPR